LNYILEVLPKRLSTRSLRKSMLNQKIRLAARLTGLLWLVVPNPASAESMVQVAELKAWPGVSQLISYNDRIWFVNSEPFKDTNVADIYSFSPASKALKYERSLFSQDVGNPVVHEGLLHWPFEDPRRSAGTGEYAVTDGDRWQWQYMESGSVMHVHAMDVCNDQLVAVTGSWTGQLHTQQADSKWQLSYDYEAGSASFSRLVNVDQFNDTCIIGAAARGKKDAKLFSLEDAQPVAPSGWPISDRVDNLTVHKDELFGFTDTGSKRNLMHFDGTETKEISIPKGNRLRALHSNGDKLWLVTRHIENKVNNGRLWVYENGEFSALQEFAQAPVSVTSHKNKVYIGTYQPGGGALWEYTDEQPGDVVDAETAELPVKNESAPLDESLVEALYNEMSEIISDPESTADYSRILRRKIGRHPSIKTAEFGAAVTRLLSEPIEDGQVTMFTRQPLTREALIRWYLLTTLAISGHGSVDPEWIGDGVELEAHSSGKHFDPSVAAIVAVGWIGQNDKPTIDALIQRLNQDSDPAWIKSDVIGSLTALTEQQFAYDVTAWNQWWQSQ